jgi:hypothetical protein
MIFYKNDMTSIKKNIIFYISLFSFFAVSHIVFGAPFTIDILNLNETEPEAASAYLTPNKLHLTEVWEKLNNDISTPIHPVKIGIIDDRINMKHPEFSGTTTEAGIIGKVNFGNTPAFTLTPPAFWGFQYFHGAAVTGIIGANNISAGGGENYVYPQMNGILSGVSWLDYTIELRSPETPITFLFGAIGRMDDLINEKVQIINWAQEIYPFDAFLNKPFQSIKKRITNNPDILFVFAAGNDGVDAETSTPAKFGNLPNVITVGAVNNNDQRAIFPSPYISSNFGNFVSISAPGLRVDTPGLTGYEAFSGTSASAPLVTGVAGLLKAIKPSLTPAQIKDILIRTADPIFAETGSDEAEMPLGSGCTATSTPQGMTKRGCRLNALAAVCDSEVGLNCESATTTGTLQGHTFRMLSDDVTVIPEGGVSVYVKDNDTGTILAETTSDSNGLYTMAVPACEHCFVGAEKYIPDEERFYYGNYPGQIQIVSGEIKDIDITIQPPVQPT